MNESLVLRIREISCVLKQLNMELRVSWKMEGGIGLQSLFLFSLLASFIISPFVPSFQQFDYCVPWCGFLHVSFAWFTELSNLHGFCNSCQIGRFSAFFFLFFLHTYSISKSNHMLIVPRVTEAWFIFFSSFFSVLYFVFISIPMSSSSLIISSAELNLLLIPWSIFISDIKFFVSNSSSWFFFI